MAEAEPVIRAALPDANVPTSIRSSGVPVAHGSTADLDAILDAWLAEHADGIACVIGADAGVRGRRPRVRSLTPELSKGLEFDLVVLVDPDDVRHGIEGAVDRYVAMTRATQQLVVLTSSRATGKEPAPRRVVTAVMLSLLDRSRTRVGVPDAEAVEATVARAVHAEQVGYERFWVAEHHAVPGIASGRTGGAAGRDRCPDVAGSGSARVG